MGLPSLGFLQAQKGSAHNESDFVLRFLLLSEMYGLVLILGPTVRPRRVLVGRFGEGLTCRTEQ